MSEATKTRKAEALELLALDAQDVLHRRHINRLTAEQAGYEVRKVHYGLAPRENPFRFALYWNEKNVGQVPNADSEVVWAQAPRFCSSVDACLMLPKPDGYFWTLCSLTENELSFAQASLGAVYPNDWLYLHRGNSLPIAMLKAWWSIQSDEA